VSAGGFRPDAVQRCALDSVASDLGRLVVGADGVCAAELHHLLTRIEELESVVPAQFPVAVGEREVPFERLRQVVVGELDALDTTGRGRGWAAFAQGDAS
jgi:hypothetical protein